MQVVSATLHNLLATSALLQSIFRKDQTYCPFSLQADVSATLHNLLATSALFNATGASPANVLRSADQLGELVALTAQLLPPIPDAAAAVLAGQPLAPPGNAAGEAAEGGGAERAEGAEGAEGGLRREGAKEEEEEAEEEEAERSCQRTRFLQENPALLEKLTADLLPPLLKVTELEHG